MSHAAHKIAALGVALLTSCAPPPRSLPAQQPDPVPQAALNDAARDTSVPREVPVLHAQRGPLSNTFARLRQIEQTGQGQLSILHLGDSHVASDTMTGELRKLMQSRWGAAGRGFTQPGRPWATWRQDGTRGSMGKGWLITNARRYDARVLVGLSGIRLDAINEGSYAGRVDRQPFTHVALHVVSIPGSGSLTVFADGAPVATLPTTAEPGAQPALRVLPIDLPSPATELRVEIVGDGPVHLLGWRTTHDAPGIRYESIGLNGARAATFLALHADTVRAEVEALEPQLIVLGFGTNEAYNLRKKSLAPPVQDDLTRSFSDLIERVREGAPQADCLVLLPMDLVLQPTDASCFTTKRVKRGKRRVKVKRLRDDLDPLVEPQCAWTSPASLDLVREASRAAAAQHQCAIWDQRAAMGGPTSHYTWAHMSPKHAASDGVHLTTIGYRALASRLFDDLADAYTRHTQGQDPALRTTPILGGPALNAPMGVDPDEDDELDQNQNPSDDPADALIETP
jgi:lysophospholipase L1-like esterase